MHENLTPKTHNTGRKTINLLRVAKGQRELVLCVGGLILLNIATYAAPAAGLGQFGMWLGVAATIGYFVLGIVAIVFAVRLALAMGSHPVFAAFGALFMLLPCVNIVILLILNARTTSLLKKYGVKVGLLGPPQSEWDKLYVEACMHCGYNLMNITSPNCPECGKPISA